MAETTRDAEGLEHLLEELANDLAVDVMTDGSIFVSDDIAVVREAAAEIRRLRAERDTADDSQAALAVAMRLNEELRNALEAEQQMRANYKSERDTLRSELEEWEGAEACASCTRRAERLEAELDEAVKGEEALRIEVEYRDEQLEQERRRKLAWKEGYRNERRSCEVSIQTAIEEARDEMAAELERRDAALREIADEETGWPFKVDPLEHARAVVEAMRDTARRALATEGDE